MDANLTMAARCGPLVGGSWLSSLGICDRPRIAPSHTLATLQLVAFAQRPTEIVSFD